MANARIIYAAPHPSGGLRATVESTASVGFAFVIGGLVIVGASVQAATSFVADKPATWAASVAAAITALGELGFLVWIGHAVGLTTGRDRVPRLALLQRPWSRALRPVLTVWWLGHLGIAVGAMLFLERGASFLREVGWGQSALMLGLLVFGYFTISHTTHLYAMLAIAAGTRRNQWVFAWWSRRFLIDAVVTLVALGFTLRDTFPTGFRSS